MAKRKKELPPEMLSKAALRERIIRRCRKVVRDCEQAIIDGEYWQSHNAEHANKIDLENFRVMRADATRTLKQFGATP